MPQPALGSGSPGPVGGSLVSAEDVSPTGSLDVGSALEVGSGWVVTGAEVVVVWALVVGEGGADVIFDDDAGGLGLTTGGADVTLGDELGALVLVVPVDVEDGLTGTLTPLVVDEEGPKPSSGVTGSSPHAVNVPHANKRATNNSPCLAREPRFDSSKSTEARLMAAA